MAVNQHEVFLDDHGQPLLHDSVTAFLDILGFSQLCRQDNERDLSQLTLNRIDSAIRSATQFVRESLTDSAEEYERGAAKFFSDNLVYALAYDREDEIGIQSHRVIRCVQKYQLSMGLDGFFIRGGITKGPICVTDRIVFGNALVDAYALESKASLVPRVIIAHDLDAPLNKFLSHNADFQDAICRDVDGWWFVNYLQAAVKGKEVNWSTLHLHKEKVIAALNSSPRHDVLPKFGWLIRYHNMFCHWHREADGFLPEYRIQRVDEESLIHRWPEVSPT